MHILSKIQLLNTCLLSKYPINADVLTSFGDGWKCEDCAPAEDPQAVHIGAEHRTDREGELLGLLAHNYELVVLSRDMMF